MTIVCPNCRTAYRIDPARLMQPAVRATCKKCGARIEISPSPSLDAAGPRRRRRAAAVAERPPDDTPSVLEMSRLRPAARDPLAVALVAVALLVLAVAVFLVVRDVHRFFAQQVAPVLRAVRQTVTAAPALPRGRKAEKATAAAGDAFARRMREGHDHFKARRFPQALAAFDGAVRARPADPDAYYWRGRARLRADRHDAAIADFKKVLELRPDDTHACDNLGWLYMKRGEYDTSLEYLNASLRVNPRNGWAYYTRGSVHFKRGDRSAAIADAKRACEAGYRKGCRMAAEKKL